MIKKYLILLFLGGFISTLVSMQQTSQPLLYKKNVPKKLHQLFVDITNQRNEKMKAEMDIEHRQKNSFWNSMFSSISSKTLSLIPWVYPLVKRSATGLWPSSTTLIIVSIFSCSGLLWSLDEKLAQHSFANEKNECQATFHSNIGILSKRFKKIVGTKEDQQVGLFKNTLLKDVGKNPNLFKLINMQIELHDLNETLQKLKQFRKISELAPQINSLESFIERNEQALTELTHNNKKMRE